MRGAAEGVGAVRTPLVVVASLALAGQSPLYDQLQKYEGQRRAYEMRERVAAMPVGIAYRRGEPLAWVSVYQTEEETARCGQGRESYLFVMEQETLYRCFNGVRTRFVEPHTVVLSWGPTQVLEFARGQVIPERTTLR